MTGYEDLDDHGSWRDDAEYGPLWIPRSVPSGWVPYRDGRWTYLQPWGWTWVDNAPWGYAPFHYGRWVVVGKRWCWAPGRHIGRPVWSPALVGWVGGSGWSVGFHSGGSYRPAPAQGWYPLAPRDSFVPHYRVKPDHLRYLNRHAHDRREHDRDGRRGHHHRHGLTVVPHEHFGRRTEVVVPTIARANVTPQLVQTAPSATPPAPLVVRRELTTPYVERHDGVRVHPRYSRPDGPRGQRDDRRRQTAVEPDAERTAAPLVQQPAQPQVIQTHPVPPQPGYGNDQQRDWRRRDEERARWRAERDARESRESRESREPRTNAPLVTGAPQPQVQPQPQPQGAGWAANTRAAVMAAQRDERERHQRPADHEQRQAPVYSAQRSNAPLMPQQVTPVPRPMPQPQPMAMPQPQPVQAAPAPAPQPQPARQEHASQRNENNPRPSRHQMLR
jgi:hypothetical protein